MTAAAAPASAQPSTAGAETGPCEVCGAPAPRVKFKFDMDPPYYLCPPGDDECLRRGIAAAVALIPEPAPEDSLDQAGDAAPEPEDTP